MTKHMVRRSASGQARRRGLIMVTMVALAVPALSAAAVPAAATPGVAAIGAGDGAGVRADANLDVDSEGLDVDLEGDGVGQEDDGVSGDGVSGEDDGSDVDTDGVADGGDDSGIFEGAALTGTASAASPRDELGRDTKIEAGKSKEVPDGDLIPLATVSVPLSEDYGIHLYGQIASTSSYSNNIEQRAFITCYRNGIRAGRTGEASVNHTGNDEKKKIQAVGLNYYLVSGARGTYVCKLFGQASDGNAKNPPHYLTAKAGKTYLKAEYVGNRTAEWLGRSTNCTKKAKWSGCDFVGDARSDKARSVYVFYTGIKSPKKVTMPSSTSTVRAWGQLEVTTCPIGTKSCPEMKGQYAKYSRSTSLKVWLEIDQLNAAGSRTCKAFHHTSKAVTYTVTDAMHHAAFPLTFPATRMSKDCGTKFLLRILVQHVSGQILKIDGVAGLSSDPKVLTSAFAAVS